MIRIYCELMLYNTITTTTNYEYYQYNGKDKNLIKCRYMVRLKATKKGAKENNGIVKFMILLLELLQTKTTKNNRVGNGELFSTQ